MLVIKRLCLLQGSRAELQGHLEKETEEHLLKAAKHAVSMETQNTELRRKLEQETNRVEVLEQKLDEGGNYFSSLNRVLRFR